MELTEIRKLRGRSKAAMTRMCKFVESATERSKTDVRIRLERLEEIWREFNKFDGELPEEESELEEFEEEYLEVKGHLINLLKRSKTSASIEINSDEEETVESLTKHKLSMACKLPSLNIPIFTGEYADWPAFKDLFSSVIQSNEELSEVQKFQYLKGLLADAPAAVIKHIPVSEASYKEAWEKLVQRYDKKKQIVNSLLNTFVSQNRVSESSHKDLRKLADTADVVIRGLRSLGDDAMMLDPWLIFLMLDKLDPNSRQAWIEKTVDIEFPSFASFLEFLNHRSYSLETFNKSESKEEKRFKPKAKEWKLKCVKCSGIHTLWNCAKFLDMDVKSRKHFVQKQGLCFCCLSGDHQIRNCRSQYNCRVCHEKHHTTLHEKAKTNFVAEIETNDKDAKQKVSLSSSVCSSKNKVTLLPTAVVSVKDIHGNLQDVRALLDSGSQATFVSESCAQSLGLRRKHARFPVKGLGAAKTCVTKGLLDMTVVSKCSSNEKMTFSAFILPKLTSSMPTEKINLEGVESFTGIQLADPTFHLPGSIDVIFGADYFFDLLSGPKLVDSDGATIAQSTKFGWIVVGSFLSKQKQNVDKVSLHVLNVNVDQDLRKFSEIEDLPNCQKQILTSEEKFCENHFKENYEINDEGRFIVKLPFYRVDKQLTDSKDSAVTRLFSMERKFKGNCKLESEYKVFMHEYENLGHMAEANDNSSLIKDENKFYLPHHGVVKESSTTTKLRVVFDASCRSKKSCSLNELLGVGPKLQRDIISILLNFRIHEIVFSADIEKMYRQILVHPSDQSFQRIIWRYDEKEPVKEYKLKTVTYGLSSASFLATRCLKQIANDCKVNSPKAARVVEEDFYMDDLLSGASTVEEAVAISDQVDSILKSYGFQLRKWKSNSFDVLRNFENRRSDNLLEIESNECSKVLGLYWNSDSDEFIFRSLLKIESPITKRKILSESAKIFDPLGLMSPCTVVIKIFYQKLWLIQGDWDSVIPKFLEDEWLKFQKGFNSVSAISIPRCAVISSDFIELHGFCDASTAAYAAVIYCKTKSSTGTEIRLLVSKTKVAPIKQISLPKLELCAAHLLSKLFKVVLESLKNHKIECFAWSDSKIVLSWLSSHPRRWKTFVANRTSEIVEVIPTSHWNYVPSKKNPADVASRGIDPELLAKCNLWWQGPAFLKQASYQWIQGDLNEFHNMKVPEERVDPIFAHVAEINDTVEKLFERCSSFSKIVRILAFIYRFYLNCKMKKGKKGDGKREMRPLQTAEIDRVKNFLFQWVQGIYFCEDLKDIKAQQPLKNKSVLSSLNPFIDDHGVLRAGGRLSQSSLSFNAKHPVILPCKHKISELLIKELHITNLHAGPTLLSHVVKQLYWIIGAKRIIRRIIHKCLVCFRFRAKSTTQIMAELPGFRVNISRPFANCGVDYAGPIQLKRHKGRGAKCIKGYIALFICLATKAIHIEAVSDLTTEAFIAALRRLSSRRGFPSHIYSDNATNFVGARRKLSELNRVTSKIHQSEDVAYFLAQSSVKWHMIPPTSPHFGGIWEAGIKSVKFHLKRVIGDCKLTFEELSTLLCQIEGLLNSRPLVASQDQDIDSIHALTPSHFLVGDALTQIPQRSDEVNLGRRWELVQKMRNCFWKRWHLEYLNSLQQRCKWKTSQPNITEGDVVILKDDNLPPSIWPLGRVMTLHPGTDGNVRVVTVKTVKGLYKRPVVKIVKLPIELSEAKQLSSSSIQTEL